MNPVLQKIKSYWQNCYKTAPDIIVKSSGRINLIGEHTDYNDGFVLPASIDKGIYVGIGKSTENTQMIALDKNEELVFSSHSNCKALFPKGAWQNYTIGVIEEIKKTGREIGDFKAVFSGDIPQGAGLSSSAALENAFVFALNKLFDLELTPWQMIKISQQAEHNYAGVQCGIMDQFASMMGEKGEVILLDCRSLDFFTKKIDLGKYQLLLINSGMSHQLANSEYNKRRAECESAVAKIKVKYKEVKALRDVSFDILNSIKLNKTEYKRTKYILEENGRVLQSVNALGKGDVATFGKILFEAHQAMKDEYEITCQETDYLVEKAKESNDVVGARQMGGGFGGCTINLIEKGKVADFFNEKLRVEYRQKFNKELIVIPVKISKGTAIIEENESFS